MSIESTFDILYLFGNINNWAFRWSHERSFNTNVLNILFKLGLGGTSFLNFMIYLRGSPQDFDNWANITGDQSWSYENLLPHFKSIETYYGALGDGTLNFFF